jgi:hypothetical protein
MKLAFFAASAEIGRLVVAQLQFRNPTTDLLREMQLPKGVRIAIASTAARIARNTPTRRSAGFFCTRMLILISGDLEHGELRLFAMPSLLLTYKKAVRILSHSLRKLALFGPRSAERGGGH